MHGQLFIPFQDFVRVRDGNDLAASIANQHYSRILRGNTKQNRLTTHKRMVLVEPLGKWVFVWNFQLWRYDGQTGANCVLFRNESERLSSEIILLAEREWNKEYGDCRKFTYVDPSQVASTNPGYCFQKAGWTRTNYVSPRGLILLVKEQ